MGDGLGRAIVDLVNMQGVQQSDTQSGKVGDGQGWVPWTIVNILKSCNISHMSVHIGGDQGRATVDMRITLKEARQDGVKDGLFRIVLDGYNAPITAGNFVDLVQRKFYDGMEIQRADGFVVQTGDPDGPVCVLMRFMIIPIPSV